MSAIEMQRELDIEVFGQRDEWDDELSPDRCLEVDIIVHFYRTLSAHLITGTMTPVPCFA